MKVIKASGEAVKFDKNRVITSLRNIGTDEAIIKMILNEINDEMTDGMRTSKIYAIAFRLLRKHSKALAAKYHLKKAIMRLGSSGYSFEKFVALLMENQGYRTSTNQIINGRCVSHEVDVVAVKNNEKVFIECKYHTRQGKRCDVKVALYIKARFLDIADKLKKTSKEKLLGCVATNTQFTSDAIQYGLCAGLNLIGWNFPIRQNLKEMVEVSRLYPITCISGFTRLELNLLFEHNVILCKSVAENPDLLNILRTSSQRRESLVNQCRALYIN